MKHSEYNFLSRTIGRPLALNIDDSGYSLVSAAFTGYDSKNPNSVGRILEAILEDALEDLSPEKREALADPFQYLKLLKNTFGEQKLNQVITKLKDTMKTNIASTSFNSLNYEFNPKLQKK